MYGGARDVVQAEADSAARFRAKGVRRLHPSKTPWRPVTASSLPVLAA
jgi:hypothetical protein